MLNRGLRTSCATPATIEPISAMVSLWRSCSLRRTVSVTSWKFSTARSAPSPSAASARALTTQVRRVSGSLTSRAAGAPPVRERRHQLAEGRPGLAGPELRERSVDEVSPPRPARVLDRRPVGADDPPFRVHHHDAEGQAVEGLPPLERGAAQVGFQPPAVRDVGPGPEDVGHLSRRVEDGAVDPRDQPALARAGQPLGLEGHGQLEGGVAAPVVAGGLLAGLGGAQLFPEGPAPQLLLRPPARLLAGPVEADDPAVGVHDDDQRGHHVEEAVGEHPLPLDLALGPQPLDLRRRPRGEDLQHALGAHDLVEGPVVNGVDDAQDLAGRGAQRGPHVALRPDPPQPLVPRVAVGHAVADVTDAPVEDVGARGARERVLDVGHEAAVDEPGHRPQVSPVHELGHGGVLDPQRPRQAQHQLAEEGLPARGRRPRDEVAERLLDPPVPHGPLGDVRQVGQGHLALHEVVHGARADGFDGHALAPVARHDHHRRHRARRRAAEEVEPLPVREQPVGDHQVGRDRPVEGGASRVHGLGHRDDEVPGPRLEGAARELRVTRLVLDEQDAERLPAHPRPRPSENGKAAVSARDGPPRGDLRSKALSLIYST